MDRGSRSQSLDHDHIADLFALRFLLVTEFLEHYHGERPHQGLGNEHFAPTATKHDAGAGVVADERLGGLLRSYRRSA